MPSALRLNGDASVRSNLRGCGHSKAMFGTSTWAESRSVAMHFDGVMNTMEGRHLVFAYVSVALIQGGYFAWVLMNWLKMNRAEDAEQKKAAKPVR